MEGTSGHMFPLEWLFAKATIAGSSVSSNTAKKQRNIGETWRKNFTEWPLHSWPCSHFKKSWSIFLCWTPEIYFRINYLRNGEYVRSKVSKSLIPSNSIYLHLGHITCSICGLPGVLDQNNWPNWRTSDWFDAAGVRSGVHARGGRKNVWGSLFCSLYHNWLSYSGYSSGDCDFLYLSYLKLSSEPWNSQSRNKEILFPIVVVWYLESIVWYLGEIWMEIAVLQRINMFQTQAKPSLYLSKQCKALWQV